MSKAQTGPIIDPLAYQNPMTSTVLNRMDSTEALDRLKQGNRRYRGKDNPEDKNNLPRIRAIGSNVKKDNKFIAATANGQNPFAIVLSCVDSRIPTEVIFDQEIGDIFNARIAGNFVNKDILGSMEFACGRPRYIENPKETKEKEWEGAKLILVLGHTSCGAIAAACNVVHPAPNPQTKGKEKKNEVEVVIPPHLLRLVKKLVPTAIATPYNRDRDTYVDDTARNNVRRTVGDILRRSDLLRGMVRNGKIQVIGAMYDVKSGKVTFLDETPV